ncbi:MAG: hypothetical protein FJ088_12240 [Deltaproteobacteria bacterium]|nr:hypothetical protein [Deltaproteobacteria bacterium]
MTEISSFFKKAAGKILWIFASEKLEYDGDHKRKAAKPAKEKFTGYLFGKERLEDVPGEMETAGGGGFLKWLFQKERI